MAEQQRTFRGNEMYGNPSAIRQCPKCKHPSLLCCTNHFGQFGSLNSQTWRCQSCGEWVGRVHPSLERWGVKDFDILAPVIPDATYPFQKYRTGPPYRRCSKCGKSMAVYQIDSVNGWVTGHRYRCVGCKHEANLTKYRISLGTGSVLLLGIGFIGLVIYNPKKSVGDIVAILFALLCIFYAISEFKKHDIYPIDDSRLP